MSHKWDTLSKPDRVKLLESAGLPIGLAQLKWSGLQKSERKKLEKGSGWFEAKTLIKTDKGLERKAPEHHKLALKKEAGKALNKPMGRKEEKPKPDESSDKSLKELIDRETFDFYYTRPNGHKDKVPLNADNSISGAKKAFGEWNENNEATVYKIEPHQTVEEELAGYKNHTKFDWLKSVKYPIEFPTHREALTNGIKLTKLTIEEERFVSGIYKQVGEGATIKEFGTRLYIWAKGEPYATKHITDSEYTAIKPIIKGVHQKSRAEALKNLEEGRANEAKIAKEIEERRVEEFHQPETSKEVQKSALNELEPLVIEAQEKGLYYLNDIKDYVSTKTSIPKEELGRKIYDILKEQQKDKPNLVEQVMENLKKQANQSRNPTKIYDSFLNTLPSMERGKAKKTLDTQLNYEGNIMTRREFIEKKAAEGGKVVVRKERMYKKEEALKEKLDIMWKTVPFGNSEYPTTKEYNKLKAELEAGIYKDVLTIQAKDESFVEVTKTEVDYFNYLIA